MRFRTTLFLFALLLSLGCWTPKAMAQGTPAPPNGVIDGIQDMVTKTTIMLPMPDGTRLSTDIYMPILWDDLAVENITLDIGITTLTIPRLQLAPRGTQLYEMPNQADPKQLSIIFTRTPYNKQSPEQGQIEAVLGYCAVLQDMRGRYASEGTYMPMYADAWAKTPYFPAGFHHPMDITPTHEANEHQDGYNSIQFLANDLRLDSNNDGVIDSTDKIITNGKIGMFGASALANSQFSAAAVGKIDPNGRGLRCLLPIVGSGQFYHSTGHVNGVFRERIIDGWLRGQVERYDYDDPAGDNSPKNGIKSLADYPPSVQNSFDAAEMAIDFWTTMGAAHYPNSPFRGIMDISHAPLNANLEPDSNGTVSRYKLMDVPVYNLTGWWDIFTDGQIETWQIMRKEVPTQRGFQKMVIGPWAHQTIGTQSTGDMRIDPVTGNDYRYKDNVALVLGASLDNISVDQIGSVAKSELIPYFQNFLGAPEVVLPAATTYQSIGNFLGQAAFARIPAAEYRIPFHEFFNFANGGGPLPNFPMNIIIPGLLNDSNNVQRITIPATGNSFFGDESNTTMPPPGTIEWDDTKPNGVPPIRFYVVGPINDGIDGVGSNPSVGNYWYSADTFPISNVQWKKMYFHQNGKFDDKAPTTNEGFLTYYNDPNNPVPTHGGANMIVRTPDNERDSQGQMNFTDPRFRTAVLDRPGQIVNGVQYHDMLKFESEAILDSLSIIGYPEVQLFMKSNPLSASFQELSNFDVVVRILDVCPDGRELFVVEGACNARFREYAESWLTQEDETKPIYNLKSDSIYKFHWQMMPIGYTFGRGHKVKVLISSTSYPRYQSCPNVPLENGQFFRRRPYEPRIYTFQGMPMTARSTLQTMAFSDVFTGFINLPMVGAYTVSVQEDKLKEELNSAQVIAYPNPASDVLAVSIDKPGTYTATLYNILGSQVMTTDFSASTTFNVVDLPRGIYVVNVSDNSGQLVRSLKVVLK